MVSLGVKMEIVMPGYAKICCRTCEEAAIHGFY